MSRPWTDLRRNQQYLTQMGNRLAGVLREVTKLRELDPPPCEGYHGALDAIEDGTRIIRNLAAALHYAMQKSTGVEEYTDYLMMTKGALTPQPQRLDLTFLLPPSRRFCVPSNLERGGSEE